MNTFIVVIKGIEMNKRVIKKIHACSRAVALF